MLKLAILAAQEAQLSLGWADRIPPISEGQRPTSVRRKKTMSQNDNTEWNYSLDQNNFISFQFNRVVIRPYMH